MTNWCPGLAGSWTTKTVSPSRRQRGAGGGLPAVAGSVRPNGRAWSREPDGSGMGGLGGGGGECFAAGLPGVRQAPALPAAELAVPRRQVQLGDPAAAGQAVVGAGHRAQEEGL